MATAAIREESVVRQASPRTWAVLAACTFAVLYVAVYVRVISPLYVESGMTNDLPPDGSIAMAVILACMPALWLPLTARRPSAIGLWILYIAGYVPSIVMPAFVLGIGWRLLPYWLALSGSFLVAIVAANRVRITLPAVALTPPVYRWLLIAFAIAGAGTGILLFGIPSRLPGLDTIYEVRDEFSAALARAGRIGGYAVWWTAAAVAPLVIGYGAWARRPLMVAGGFGLFALVYGLAAFRSIFFTAIVLVALLTLVRRFPRHLGILAPTASIAVIVTCVAIAAIGWFIPLSLGVRRLLIVPGQVISYYYDHFANGPHYLLSHSVLSGITDSPYDASPAVVIGRTYFGQTQNANGNLWADGLANFGLPGLIGASLLLGVLLIGLDAAARGKPVLVAVAVGGLSIWSVTNSGLLTAVMTHGIGLTAALIWLLPREDGPPMHGNRVAHLTSVHRSDDPRILLKECSSLARSGYEVTLVGRGDPPAKPPPGVRFVSAGNAGGRIARMVTLPVRVLICAWRLRADVYHVHDPELLPVAMILKLGGARAIYDAHEDLPRQIEYKEYIPGVLRRPVALVAGGIEQVAVRLLDAVVTATPRIATRFPAQKTVVVQNFPLMSEFGEEAIVPYEARPMLVAYVGRITEAVGARTMAEAANHLQRDGVRTVLAGPIDPALEKDLRRTTASANIDFPGWLGRSEVQELLGAARVGIVLFQPVGNYVEAYPTKLFEYMASSVPVIASDFPLWRQIVESAGCGILVDPTDARAVAAAIDRLLADPELSAEMGARGRRAVLEDYRWETQADRLSTLYARLLSAPRPLEIRYDGRDV